MIIIPNLAACVWGLIYVNHVPIAKLTAYGVFAFYRGCVIIGFVISYIVEVQRRWQYALDAININTTNNNNNNIDKKEVYKYYAIKPDYMDYVYTALVIAWTVNEIIFVNNHMKSNMIYSFLDTVLFGIIYFVILRIQDDAISLKPWKSVPKKTTLNFL